MPVSINNDVKITPSDVHEYVELKRYIFWVLATMVPMTVISIVTAIISDSLTMYSVALDYATSLILHIFNMVSVLVIMRRNAFNFPYGTGKLENLSGLMYAIIVIPSSLLFLYFALIRFLRPPDAINLGLAQITMIFEFLRSWWLYVWASRLCRRYAEHSPMTHSYHVNFRIALIGNISINAVMLIGSGLAGIGYLWAAIMVDLIMSLSVAFYMFYCAVGVLIKNFTSLIDLPLPEADQHKILKAMVEDFDAYEGIGNLYTQLSGSTRLVQMELYFTPETTVEEIEHLKMSMEGRLKAHFGKLIFHLIPLVQKKSMVSPCLVKPTTGGVPDRREEG